MLLLCALATVLRDGSPEGLKKNCFYQESSEYGAHSIKLKRSAISFPMMYGMPAGSFACCFGIERGRYIFPPKATAFL